MITVKRSELHGLKSLINSAEADPAYTGSVTFGGADEDGSTKTVSILVAEESPKE